MFKIEQIGEKYIFFALDIEKETFYQSLFDYFFDTDKIVKHIFYKTNINFEIEKKHLNQIYRELKKFIDEENIKDSKLLSQDEDLVDILIDEFETRKDGDTFFVRNDKIGKIGEYIFSILLENHFDFKCILPKNIQITDYNMSIYGIDVLYFSKKDSLILFGESKVSKNLSNGVKLINRSLESYEKQINDEYSVVLTQTYYDEKIMELPILYKEGMEKCLSFSEFIKFEKIKKIGIPVFISHGEEFDKDIINTKLSKIKKQTFFGLETIYYIISLPIINKDIFIEVCTRNIGEKLAEYGK